MSFNEKSIVDSMLEMILIIGLFGIGHMFCLEH